MIKMYVKSLLHYCIMPVITMPKLIIIKTVTDSLIDQAVRSPDINEIKICINCGVNISRIFKAYARYHNKDRINLTGEVVESYINLGAKFQDDIDVVDVSMCNTSAVLVLYKIWSNKVRAYFINQLCCGKKVYYHEQYQDIDTPTMFKILHRIYPCDGESFVKLINMFDITSLDYFQYLLDNNGRFTDDVILHSRAVAYLLYDNKDKDNVEITGDYYRRAAIQYSCFKILEDFEIPLNVDMIDNKSIYIILDSVDNGIHPEDLIIMINHSLIDKDHLDDYFAQTSSEVSMKVLLDNFGPEDTINRLRHFIDNPTVTEFICKNKLLSISNIMDEINDIDCRSCLMANLLYTVFKYYTDDEPLDLNKYANLLSDLDDYTEDIKCELKSICEDNGISDESYFRKFISMIK